MAASPRYKIYFHNTYEGSTKDPDRAAMLVACLGEGSDVRDGHRKKDIIWREGSEAFSAAESYDGAADVMTERIREQHDAYMGALLAQGSIDQDTYDRVTA
jgi:hypothetical protein